MAWLPFPALALRRLLVRSVVLYALLRAAVTVLNQLAASQGGSVDHPAGIVLLATLLGYIDLKRRGELLLWANLGYGAASLCGLSATTAVTGEAMLFWLRHQA